MRWRQKKATLRAALGGPVPDQELWCVVDLAAAAGFRVRDAARFVGRPHRQRRSAHERRWPKRSLARCRCGRFFKVLQHCPSCGEHNIPF